MQVQVPTYITAPELFQRLTSTPQSTFLLDVRTPAEFQEHHIGSSRNVPLDQIAVGFHETIFGKDLIVICESGKRSIEACEFLLKSGLKPTLLVGGLTSWQEAGFQLAKSKAITPERQAQLAVGVAVLIGVLLSSIFSRRFLVIPAVLGAGLTVAGASGRCGITRLLEKAPWNSLCSIRRH